MNICFEISSAAFSADLFVFTKTRACLSLFIVSNDLIHNAIFHRNKNDYYSANILIRKVYENPFVLNRLYGKNKILDFFENKLSKDLTNVNSAICRFCKDFEVSDVDKKSIINNYDLLCRCTHYNLLNIGQYKQHIKEFNLEQRKLRTYNFKSDKDTVTFITLSFQNMIAVIEKMSAKKPKYDKKIFDRIFNIIEISKKEILEIIP